MLPSTWFEYVRSKDASSIGRAWQSVSGWTARVRGQGGPSGLGHAIDLWINIVLAHC